MDDPQVNTAVDFVVRAAKQDGSLVSGLSLVGSLRRESDGKYWNGADWQVAECTNALTDRYAESNDDHDAGMYDYTYTFTATGVYTFRCQHTFTGETVATTWDAEIRVRSGAGLADGEITAAKIATDALTAAKLAADAVSEIQSGLALEATVDAVGVLCTAINAKTANLPASPAATGDAMELVTDAVDADAVAASAVAEIQAGLAQAGGAMTLADGAITAAKIASAAFTAGKFAADALVALTNLTAIGGHSVDHPDDLKLKVLQTAEGAELVVTRTSNPVTQTVF